MLVEPILPEGTINDTEIWKLTMSKNKHAEIKNKIKETTRITHQQNTESTKNDTESEDYLFKNLPKPLRLLFNPAILISIAFLVEISYMLHKPESKKYFSILMTSYGSYFFYFIALAMLSNLTVITRFIIVRYAFVLIGYIAVSLIISTVALSVI